MSIAKILVPVRGDGKGENVLAHAAAVARRHNAHVEAVHCRARPKDMIPYGVVVPTILREQIEAQAVELANAEEASLEARFREAMGRLGLELIESGTPPRDRPSASWREAQGKQMDVIKRHGRLADLVAVAKPDRDRNLGVNTLKAALFNTGRPVLVCPPADTAPQVLGERVAIAWNGSTEAARAVALALPLIQAANEIVVLDGGAGDHGASGDELLRYLEIRGVEARHEPIAGGDNPGRAILAAAAAAGADLLVMGAYSHSREHESVFGGATQHVVDRTTMPVVLVH
ncbi:MAG: universal stress protein [Alphaproteobacteria bacterium]